MNKLLPKDLKWCQHIHNWGNAFYYIDSHNPFNIDEEYLRWQICPICKTERPEE